jgi:hypothetical protein
MSRLTKAEKIALAKAEVDLAELMVKSSRKKLQEWIDVLEIRQEYLEAVAKVSDLVLDDSEATTDTANPPLSAELNKEEHE